MAENTEQKDLVGRFRQNLSYYKATQNAYNEHSCRIENIDPLLEILVSPPNHRYREAKIPAYIRGLSGHYQNRFVH